MLTTRTTLRASAAAVAVGALLLAGCGSDSDGAAKDTTTTASEGSTTAAAQEIEVSDVWARKSPAGTTMGAAYLTITSPVDDALVGVSVSPDVAAEAQIHETVMAEGDDAMSTETSAMAGDEMTTTTAMGGDMTTETTMGEDMGGDGGMTMQEVDSIELPAGEAVVLEPGGYHIMLIDLAAPLEVGDTFEITLTFEDAVEKTVTAEVREA